MVDAIVSSLVQQLTSFIDREMQEEVKLVVGVDKEVEKLTNNLRSIQAVLVDAEKRQVKEETVNVWLDQLKYTSYNMEDVLDEWNTARIKLKIQGAEHSQLPQKKVCSFLPTNCFGFKQVVLRHDIAHKIKEINENLDEIAKAKNNFTFNTNVIKSFDEKSERVQSVSFIDESEIYGRGVEKNTLISKLVGECSSEQKDLHIISLVGMGGIGKTTLAQLAYNNVEVKQNFEKTIWVCVSESFDEFRIARAIIDALKCPSCNSTELETLMQTIYESIIEKKFLLILDDVWNEDYRKWDPFYQCLKNGFRGSKILITTRKETVAHMMRSTDIISINKLTEEECWSLCKQLAFFRRSPEECEKLEHIGRKISSKCKGLPLAAKTIGSLLHSKRTEEEWQYILDSEMWEQEELEKGLFAPLLLSYNDLPSMVKRCFSFCAIFSKDYLIHKDELIKLWMAQGYLTVRRNKEIEIIGEEYFNILATRSFLQEFEKDDTDDIIACKMHDIVHDFARFLSKNECFVLEVNNHKESLIDSRRLNVYHTMLMLDGSFPFPYSICKPQRLRSLLICGENVHYTLTSEVLEELFCKLTYLRVLDLDVMNNFGHASIEEIPISIDKLVHLRYLNLSGQNIKMLPEKLCELYNLEILDVRECRNLKELPQGIGKLINMKYLLNNVTGSLWSMPIGIERLTNLRRLTKFVHSSQGCTFESLKNLKLLQECRIYRLGNVSDVGETKRLELDKKKNLLVLALGFDRDEEGGRKNEEDEQLLKALQPPLSLKKLQMWDYRGNFIFSSWMMSLTKMKSLELYWCENCEHLPPLGKLPSLETLFMRGISSLKKLGNEFLGVESYNSTSSSSSSSLSSSTIFFPKLKSLEIQWMNELEEWDYGNSTARNGEIMPRLSKLTITCCSKLKALPDHILRTTTLQALKILGCSILKERYEEGTGEDWPKISHIPNTEFW